MKKPTLRCRLFGHLWATEPVYESGTFIEFWQPPAAPEGVEPSLTAHWRCRRGCGTRHFSLNPVTGTPLPSPGIPSL